MTTTTLVKIDKLVEFTPVTGSSLIIAYARIAGDLAIKLVGKQTYLYKSVDQTTFENFVRSASKGTFFCTDIKPRFIAEQAE